MRVESLERELPRGTWNDAPWTVKVYAVATVAGLVTWLALRGTDDWATAVLGALLPTLIAYGVIRGYRGAWIVAMFLAVLGVLGVVGYVFSWRSGPTREFAEETVSIGVWLVTTAMLVHPLTRQWAKR